MKCFQKIETGADATLQRAAPHFKEQCVVLSGPLESIKRLAVEVVEIVCKDIRPNTDGYIPYLDPKMQLHEKCSGPMS